MPSYHIHFKGKVQGVGFRPFIFRLATKMNITGWVANENDGVHLIVTGSKEAVETFFESIIEQAPKNSFIKTKSIKQIEDTFFHEFRIVKNHQKHPTSLIITPDIGICGNCKSEIKNKNNKRFEYAFTTCTDCGPRYSIMNQLPYERENTSMNKFNMCKSCEEEYEDTNDKRFYSQSNSCPKCAIELKLFDSEKKIIESNQKNIIIRVVEFLEKGKIIAVKGIGGYILMVDACNAESIVLMRKRKNRPFKPFAVMYPNIEMATNDVWIKKEELKALVSKEAPIVIVRQKEKSITGIQKELIAPGLNELGVQLPYTPLFELILSLYNKPLISTSGNLSKGSIEYQDESAIENLSTIADYILCYNRDILIPQDDSVLRFTEKNQKKILMRRSRGYVPSLEIECNDLVNNKNLLAMGADLKSTFSIATSGNIFVSQYLGDLSSYDNQINYNKTLNHLLSIFEFKPSAILIDKHPDYQSSNIGERISKELSTSLIKVQHHEAHFAALLGENNLINNKEDILGVIWDGMGIDNDKLIRGGEFLLYKTKKILPLLQIEPFPHILNNKMQSEPRISALAICNHIKGMEEFLEKKFTKTEWNNYRCILNNQNTNQSTSVGRLFDAVASLLGICNKISYEGEAAILLKTMALKCSSVSELQGYQIERFKENNIPVKEIFEQILEDIKNKISIERIAAKFHVTLVNIIEQVALSFSVPKITFSGGVFQNCLLVDLIIDKLSDKFELYFHQKLSPNDECISFGQIIFEMNNLIHE